MIYTYKIAGDYWKFQTAYTLEEDDETSIFRVHECKMKESCTCLVNLVEELPLIPGDLVAENREKRIYLHENSLWIKMENLSDRNPTFVSRCAMDKWGEIELWMLKQYYPYSARMAHLWSAIDLPYQLLKRDKLTLHSATIEVGGRAIAFLAPSGTGKSTQARLWEQYRNARQLNGDKNILFFKDDAAYAAGAPFCGTSGIFENYELELGALVFLQQAKTNTVHRLTGVEALKVLLDNCFGYRAVPKCMEKMVMLVTKLIEKVPVYLLACTPDERAVETLEKLLNTEKNK